MERGPGPEKPPIAGLRQRRAGTARRSEYEAAADGVRPTSPGPYGFMAGDHRRVPHNAAIPGPSSAAPAMEPGTIFAPAKTNMDSGPACANAADRPERRTT